MRVILARHVLSPLSSLLLSTLYVLLHKYLVSMQSQYVSINKCNMFVRYILGINVNGSKETRLQTRTVKAVCNLFRYRFPIFVANEITEGWKVRFERY